jgi:hypothetical protein
MPMPSVIIVCNIPLPFVDQQKVADGFLYNRRRNYHTGLTPLTSENQWGCRKGMSIRSYHDHNMSFEAPILHLKSTELIHELDHT